MIELQIIALIACSIFNAYYAYHLGRSPILWTVLYFLLPPMLSLFLLFLLGETDEKRQKNLEKLNESTDSTVSISDRRDGES